MRAFEDLLREFVAAHFDLPSSACPDVRPGRSMEENIDALWDVLTRGPDRDLPPHSTQIPLPHPYVVPGGRFGESYYWDAYFIALGLVASGRVDLLEHMVSNFAHLIDRFGHIPNGNRVYYLGRSQPPFFCAMLQLLERERGAEAARHLPRLEAEYRYWMDGGTGAPGGGPAPHRRIVIMPDGAVPNRYWDDHDAPCEEAFREDEEIYRRAAHDRRVDLYRNLRAAAESGWDSSSRWLVPDGDGDWKLETIRTTEILPVDLNCLLYNMERQLAAWLEQQNPSHAAEYAAAAVRRRAAIRKYFWSDEHGFFFDYCWTEGEQTDIWSLAGVYPVCFGLASDAQAGRVAGNVVARFLRKGGLISTTNSTGEQWDAPNGWAPLQWMAVWGLRDHDLALAREIAGRFTAVAEEVYRRIGKMMEKYDVCDPDRPGGGEYPVQDGFGWTNGVVKAFISISPPMRRTPQV
jgi:alpha,alpha-trehalase